MGTNFMALCGRRTSFGDRQVLSLSLSLVTTTIILHVIHQIMAYYGSVKSTEPPYLPARMLVHNGEMRSQLKLLYPREATTARARAEYVPS